MKESAQEAEHLESTDARGNNGPKQHLRIPGEGASCRSSSAQGKLLVHLLTKAMRKRTIS